MKAGNGCSFVTDGTGSFHNFVRNSIDPPPFNRKQLDDLAIICDHFLNHRFDLLGSGWVEVRHGAQCRGVEGYRYTSAFPLPDDDGSWLERLVNRETAQYAKQVWGLIEKPYSPIDWQLDFKSGFRWSESTWFKDIRIAPREGADIKVPWELSRLQHLPVLAVAYHASLSGQLAWHPEMYLREFRNQVLDFIGSNPPGYGVNWVYSMEVGIRIVNVLTAFELFRSFGAKFDPDFEDVLWRSTRDHGLHITNNLEWHPYFRSNHYLANLTGLLYAAAFLGPATDESARNWWVFAVRELNREIEIQFGPDGGNFEGSTSYHCLSSELAAVGASLLVGAPESWRVSVEEFGTISLGGVQSCPLRELNDGLLTETSTKRLQGMKRFCMALARPDGLLPQVGDNDSGRVFRLIPEYVKIDSESLTFMNLEGNADNKDQIFELSLRRAYVPSSIDALFGRDDRTLDSWLIRSFLGQKYLSTCDSDVDEVEVECRLSSWEDLRKASKAAPMLRRYSIKAAHLNDNVCARGFPNFGVYVYRSPRLYLSIRCGAIGQKGLGGHSHLDQLSIELWVDGENIVTDPGSYLYTSSREWRDRYRSAGAHFGPALKGSNKALMRGPFILDGVGDGECLVFNEAQFCGCYQSFGDTLWRSIELSNQGIEIVDWSTARSEWEPYANVPYSPAYGWRFNDSKKEQSVFERRVQLHIQP